MEMTRRSFVATSCAAALMPAARAAADEWRAGPLPDYVDREIARTQERLVAWKKNDPAVVFPVLSDVHDGVPEIAAPVDWGNRKMHQLFADRAAQMLAADFTADLGDIGCDRDTSWRDCDRAFWARRVAAQVRIFRAFKRPALHCIGNHDLGNSRFWESARAYAEPLNAPLARLPGVTLADDFSYGLWDFPAARVRVVFLNTSDGVRTWSGVGGAQTAFFRAALDVPSAWHCAILSHIGLLNGQGHWLGRRSDEEEPWRDHLAGLVEEAARTRRDRFYSCFCGHGHVDSATVRNRVAYAMTQSYGTNAPHWYGDNRYNWVDLQKALLIDVAVVKANGAVALFRIGTGGAACDRILVNG